MASRSRTQLIAETKCGGRYEVKAITSPVTESSEVEKSLASVTIGEPEVRLRVIAASSQAASSRRWITLASSGS